MNLAEPHGHLVRKYYGHMPAPLVHAYAKESGKSQADIESYFQDAEASAAKKFGKGTRSYWAYANAIVRRRLGLPKNIHEVLGEH